MKRSLEDAPESLNFMSDLPSTGLAQVGTLCSLYKVSGGMFSGQNLDLIENNRLKLFSTLPFNF